MMAAEAAAMVVRELTIAGTVEARVKMEAARMERDSGCWCANGGAAIECARCRVLESIDELILLVTHLKHYDGPNCDLIKYRDLLVIIMGSDNKIK